ncbi:COG1470 family protein [Saccharicrinis sp. GN24d3]|uniref:COG1470 family protein n=1 Tax=Saccharicrinis sp. GN24d3 TaxID=3458416 RepID=UPI004036006E
MRIWISVILLLVVAAAQAQFRQNIGGYDFSDWSGIEKVKKGAAIVAGGDTISYTYANQNRVYFPGISRPFNGDAADWTEFTGLAFDIYLNSETATQLAAILKVDELDYSELNPVSTANFRLTGKGWHTVYLPWDRFDVDVGQRRGTLFAVKHVLLTAATNKDWQVRNVRVTRGLTTSLKSDIQGKSSDAGKKVIYEFDVGNTTDYKQGVQLMLQTQGWESMEAKLSEEAFDLVPGEIKKLQLEVTIPENLPTGIREKQVVRAMSNGFGASDVKLEFITAVRVPTPNIVFTAEGWQEVNDKVAKYDWARKGYENYIRKAEGWRVPDGNDFSKIEGRPLGKSIFNTNGAEFYDCGIAYQLTKNEEYAAKCLKLLRRLSDPETGYPATLVGGSNSFVGEGKFWQAVGRMYDLVRDSKQFTEQDHKQILATFRLFATQTIKGNSKGAISNWNVAELTAAFYCAMNLQDWHLIEQLLSGPTGIYKHLEHGIMNDGWWYECAVGYNTWVASEFSEIAIALQPWGINFKDMQFPLGTSKHFSLLASRRQGGIMGMEFEKWGNMERNYVRIKDMWDASIPYIDFRGVLPAINDAVEDKVSGKSYELAYYLYRDPEYAAIINRGNGRDLLYGVTDLPDVTSEKMKQSAYADNMGVVMLRSQTKDREQREQIQAALHYGSHGGYHGHFDRTSLVNMTRYGRSFYGTLAYWFRYQSYLYKFWKQTSVNKNMVVVDEKMQLPVQNARTLFHSGDMMQATAIETNSRWSYPPYGGIPSPDRTFAQKMWDESRTIAMPENAPGFGEVSGYTEPVMQRRALVVMDDYIVLADYLEGEEEHQFDWMLQIKGFKDITAEKIEYARHTSQMNTDPLGSAQFITDCHWWKTEGTSKAMYEMCWGEGCDNKGLRYPHGLEGPLKIDVHNAWPLKKEVMVGTSTQSINVNKKMWYTVAADGEELLNDSTGAWILGSQAIELNLIGKKRLELITKTEKKINNNTLFWGDAKLILKDGSEVFVSSLPVKYENVLLPDAEGLDYYGGPIKIQGELMSNSTPAMPEDLKQAAKVVVDLTGLDVVAFKAKVGGDYPLGNEAARLKNMAVRTYGKKARYLAVIEPYETEALVKSVTAKSENELVVELNDGRVQEITIWGLEGDGKNIKISTKELLNGEVIREEESN